jgi:putative heme-binding domain-containing protein
MFAGHQAERPIQFSEAERKEIAKQLLGLLDRRAERFEVARLIGMLEINDSAVAKALSQIAAKEKDPVTRIHYLNCLAVAKGRMSLPASDRVADALLRVRREIDAAELPVDRNWQPRMGQLATELFRNMNIPEAIVKDDSFGQPSDMWIYDSLPEIFRGIARTKIAGKIQQDPKTATRKQLQCLSVDPQHVALIRSFADEDEFTDVLVMSISSTPVKGDRGVLMRGLKSFSLTVNKAALIGLRKIEGDKPEPDDFASLLRLEKQLGWTNPEVSVRDQIVKLLQKWTGQSFGYEFRKYDLQADPIRRQRVKIDRWKNHLAAERSIKIEAAASVSDLIERFSKIDFSKSDSGRGKLAYKKYQCAACHDGGGQNSGPSLVGIASRFSLEDVLRAIVDPNENVPDRYRAVVVATEDGQLFRGSVVYESMAGIMLATSTGEVVRIDAVDIESRRKSTKSLMPEGLLNEASDQEVADLWAYLRELK